MISAGYLLARRLLGRLIVLARREVPGDAELLVLRHENAVLRRPLHSAVHQQTTEARSAARRVS
jgi:hypothetical protein